MPRGKYPHKPRTDEARQAQAEAMRRHWASLTEDQRSERGKKISASLTGRVQPDEHRKHNSEGHKGTHCSVEQSAKISASLASQLESQVVLEDVKGWWKPSHKAYPKVRAFQSQYPRVRFQITVREGLL